jgi:predicted XRE-type DNA-binding protein
MPRGCEKVLRRRHALHDRAGRFSIDRLVTILGRLGQEVEFSFTVPLGG